MVARLALVGVRGAALHGSDRQARRALRRAALAVLAAAALAAGGCQESAGPEDEGVDETSLEFLRFPPDLIPLATRDTSFWAVSGDNRELVIRYRPEVGEEDDDGEEFLEFRVSGSSLLSGPDGAPYAEGDSVEIRVQVDPEGRFLFRFEPSGLRFSPDDPAELEITYIRLNGDLDGDGDVDGEDDDVERRLRLWKQESPGDPWFPVGSVKIEELDEIEAEIASFTGFAIAI